MDLSFQKKKTVCKFVSRLLRYSTNNQIYKFYIFYGTPFTYYHTDVIVSCLCDSITQTWFGTNCFSVHDFIWSTFYLNNIDVRYVRYFWWYSMFRNILYVANQKIRNDSVFIATSFQCICGRTPLSQHKTVCLTWQKTDN